MAEAIKIEIFRQKNADEFTKSLADPDSRLETGSASALTAALSAALLGRAAALTAAAQPGEERPEYIARNAEILRGYMVHLIDEDVKCRGPLRRALKEGDSLKIEAARQPAIAITGEIINMMSQALALAAELCGFCPSEAMHYLGESAELALAAIRSARIYTVNMADLATDETYRFVVRRENEITWESCLAQAETIRNAVEKAI